MLITVKFPFYKNLHLRHSTILSEMFLGHQPTNQPTNQRNATQRNATQRNATQRNATQRNATQAIYFKTHNIEKQTTQIK